MMLGKSKHDFSWYLYAPPDTTKPCTIGDLVYIRSKSAQAGKRGRIVQVCNGRATLRLVDSSSPHADTTHSVQLKRLIPLYNDDKNTSTTIILSTDTYPYRHLAASQITLHDQVLEIGCSTGEASTFMLRTTRHWLGFDVSQDMVTQARAFLQNTKGHDVTNRIYKHNVLMDPTGATQLIQTVFDTKSGPTVVFVDIGGNRDASSAIRVLQYIIMTLSPRLIVIKNRKLVNQCTSACQVMVQANGYIPDAHQWFQQLQQLEQNETLPLKSWPAHPLQAPLVVSPVDNTTPICRYHNYATCKKMLGSSCKFDHAHCHWCQQVGHKAKKCPMRSEMHM